MLFQSTKSKRWILLGLFGLLFMAFTPNAHATIELTLDDGAGHTAHVFEGNVLSGDVCGTAGCVTYIKSNFGIWSIAVSTVLSNHPGNPVVLDLNVSATAKKSTTGGNLTITATDTNYSPASSQFFFDTSATQVPTASTVTMNAWGGFNNSPFDMTHFIGQTFFSSPASGVSITQNYNTVSPYSATIQGIISMGKSGGTLSFDDALSATPVPEPAVVTMLGGILLCTVGAIRRRARRS